ncbi:chain B, Stru [Campylobacter coli]|uniref:chain B, Stru n=1 Tax=Campylobacter coli TaxID=195 RepID=UPI0037517797
MYRQMVQTAAEHGWGDYRAAPTFQDDVMGAYFYNNHILRRFNEQLKDCIDPNGILAPSRGGIWPKNLRDERFVNNKRDALRMKEGKEK